MKLKKQIDRAGLKQKWIAKKLKISPAYMCQLLNGTRPLYPEMRERIEKVLNNR